VTAVASAFSIRVMVTDAWDQVALSVTSASTVAEIKREALTRALGRVPAALDDYIVKFHGGVVTDEAQTLASLGVRPNAPFIIMGARRQVVR
jgi:hypothetical protein